MDWVYVYEGDYIYDMIIIKIYYNLVFELDLTPGPLNIRLQL